MSSLQGKTALVTGAGRGIGLACALSLAQKGARLIINDRPGSADLATAVARIQATGADCDAVEADVFQRSNCETLLSTAIDTVGPIDILISNPAFSRKDDFLSYDPAVFEKTLQCTLASGFHLGQLVARHLIQRGKGGKMLFISSVHGQMPLGRSIAYNAAKAGLNHLVRSMAVELMAHRINVNAIAPGWIDTPGERETFPADVMTKESKKLPWGRMGMPEEIGKSAAFLCSDDADYITGVVLPVDGGFRFKDCLPESLPQDL